MCSIVNTYRDLLLYFSTNEPSAKITIIITVICYYLEAFTVRLGMLFLKATGNTIFDLFKLPFSYILAFLHTEFSSERT